MSLDAGTRLGPYEILGLLGTGGMGEVYRARDSRLHREVALKILPEATASEAAAEARFERESRAIASVNHPNICAVHDVGVDAGRRFLVMELLEGETLQERLLRGAFDIPDFLEHGAALADALHAAHARGVIHRDLKPANIFLTTHGHLKILDFGLAKAADSADGQTRAADNLITAKGIAVGTAAYMSPEQIRGESLDARTDVFSLGLVLFEMTTGQRAFSGNTGAAVAASILNHEAPRPGTLRGGLPSRLEEAILTALEKDRDLRYQSAADLRADLKRIRRQLAAEAAHPSEGVPAGTPAVASPATTPRPTAPAAGPSSSSDTQLLGAIISRHRVWLGVAVLMAVIAAVAVAWLVLHDRGSSTASPALANVQIQPLTFGGDATLGAISPDGRFVIYLRAGRGVRVRQISGDRDIELVPPDRFSRISSMTVTPDSNFVDVVAVTGAGPLPDAWRIPLLGGNPRPLLPHVVSAIGWSPNGQTMAFVKSEGLASGMTVVTADAEGSNQRELPTRRAPKMFFGDFTPSRSAEPTSLVAGWPASGVAGVLVGHVRQIERTGCPRRKDGSGASQRADEWRLERSGLARSDAAAAGGGRRCFGTVDQRCHGKSTHACDTRVRELRKHEPDRGSHDRRCQAVHEVERNLAEQRLRGRRRNQSAVVFRRRGAADRRRRGRSDLHRVQTRRCSRRVPPAARRIESAADRRSNDISCGRFLS